jgi:hypothetical protein
VDDASTPGEQLGWCPDCRLTVILLSTGHAALWECVRCGAWTVVGSDAVDRLSVDSEVGPLPRL